MIISEFVFNFTFLTFGVLLVCTLYRKYYVRARFMKYRFRVFALRDRLAKLVCEGQLDERSNIYRFHLDCLNTSIRHLESLDLYSLLMWRLKTEKDEDFIRTFRAVAERTKRENPAVADIMREYENSILHALHRNSWILRNPGPAIGLLTVAVFVGSKKFRAFCLIRVREMIEVPEIAKQRLATAGIPVTG